MSLAVHEATPAELLDWDARTVDVAGGNVYQSLAWARHRQGLGWRPRFLAFDDGFRLLSLERPWPLVGGSGAYLSRGPVSAGEPASMTAERLLAAADHLAASGVDVVASDAEIEAASGYGPLIEAGGFRPIEEVQPSRHRMALRLPPGSTEESVFRGASQTARQMVRYAERAGLRVVRWDTRAGATGGGAEREDGFETPPPEALEAGGRGAFDGFYDLLAAAAARRGFGLGLRSGFVDWSAAGLAAGHVLFLQVLDSAGTFLGGATFYRHGGRLTYSHAGDRADLRRTHPGVMQLLVWRAIQLAIRDGMVEMDLAGADVAGARRRPVESEPMYGIYAFKRAFGAEWVELAGNHERVSRPWRYLAGRLTGRLAGFSRSGRR